MSASDPINAGDTIMPVSALDEAIKWKLALVKDGIDYAAKKAQEILTEMQRGDFQYASDLSALARILNGAVPERTILESPPAPDVRLEKWHVVVANLTKQYEWEEDFFRNPHIDLDIDLAGREASLKP